MTTIDKIKELIKDSGKSAASILKELGMNPNTITDWGSKAKPSADALHKLADHFNVSTDYLLGRTDDPRPLPLPANAYTVEDYGPYFSLPVIGSIAAGYDGLAVEKDTGELQEFSENSTRGYPRDELFVLRVSGNSMFPDFHNGDRVLVHRQTSVDSGSVAVIMYGGENATLKRVEYKNGQDWMKLIPRNPEYEEKLIEGEDLEQCRVLGRVLCIVYRQID